jgi:hypothetical protein
MADEPKLGNQPAQPGMGQAPPHGQISNVQI